MQKAFSQIFSYGFIVQFQAQISQYNTQYVNKATSQVSPKV